jgi:hypothetical protein
MSRLVARLETVWDKSAEILPIVVENWGPFGMGATFLVCGVISGARYYHLFTICVWGVGYPVYYYGRRSEIRSGEGYYTALECKLSL